MKTFTNYAEKKANKFFNLLQNYTKGIRFTAMLMLMLMGVSNAWAYTIGGTTIYADNYGTNWESIMIHMWSGDWNTQWKFTNISGTDYWYYNSTSAYGYAGYLWAEEDWGSQTANIEDDGAQSSWYTKCYSLKEGTWVTPGLKNVTYTKNTTTTLAGSGTNSNPYIVAPGTKITVKLSGDLIDSNCSKSYKFGTSSATTTQTNTLASSAVAGTSYSKEGFTGSTRGSYSSRYASAGTLYFNTAYNISASVSGGNGSVAITSGGNYVYTDNTSFTIKATPNTGYEVDTWTVTGGTKSGSGNTITVTASNTSNVTVVVTFKPIQYTVTYGIYNSTGGSIKLNSGSAVTSSSSSSIDHGTNITFTATPATGYQIEGWYSNAACTSSLNNGTNTTYTISSLTAAATVYVKFEPIPETKYDVEIIAGANGSVSPSGTQQVGESGIDIEATANDNYQFSQWTTTGGATVANANSASTTVTATAAGTVTANFTEIMRTITVTCNTNHGTVSPSSTTAGVVTPSGNIAATPKTGYDFANWTATTGITLADAYSATTTITQATADGTVTANFQEKKHNVTVSYKYGDTTIKDNTTTSNVGEVTSTNITAPTIAGYTFSSWTLGTGITNKSANTTTNPISITTKSSGTYTLTANYTRNSYTLTFGVQGLGGSVEATENSNAISSPATLEHGTEVTLTATPSSKYKFSKWVNASGTEISTDNPYTHNLTANTTINAVFLDQNILYLKPNSSWSQGTAWFAAYFFKAGSDDKMWVKMKNVNPCGGSDYYKVQIPEGGWDKVIFCRMNPEKGALDWDSKWNQTGDLTIPTNDNNLFTVPVYQEGKSWDGATTTWSTFTPPYHEPVVYNVTVPAGTPNCFIIGEWDGWSEFIKMNKVDDTHYTIALYDACNTHKYKYCYGQSWACQEVAGTGNSTETVKDRTHKNNDVVIAWIKYCLVGYNANWDWQTGFEFDFEGNMNQHLASTNNHEFKIKSSIGEYYTTNSQDKDIHKFTREHSSEYIPQTDGSYHNLILNVDLADRYYFHFNPINKLLSITFPEDGYRVKITMSDGAEYTSNAVKNNTDILSFFAPGSTDDNIEGSVKLLYKGKEHATISPELFDTSRVYTAKLNSTNDGLAEIAPYKGNMYIRTDAAVGGWNDFRQEGNKMTYSSYAERHSEFNHYFCKWIENPQDGHTNVRFVIANEYNSSISDTLDGDNIINYYDRIGFLPYSANVRFSWDSRTNKVGRAYISGSTNVADRFLVLKGDEKLTDLEGNNFNVEGLEEHEAIFADMGNWVYQLDVKAGRGTPIQLTAKYNNIEQQFFSTRGGSALDATSNDSYKVRFIYDFKTNHLVAAWLLDDIQVSDGAVLNSNMLVMRKHHEQTQQLKLNVDKELSEVRTAYGVMSFDKYFLNNRDKDGNALAQDAQKSIYERALYWVSFPFDVRIRDVFGFGEYMDTWIMEYYDGETRAKKGAWADSESYWTYITDLDYVLKAGVGYVLCLDLDKMGYNSSVFAHTDEVSLYFPSIGNVGTINNNPTTVKLDAHDCTIEREQRNIYDDNWNVIGVPVFSNFDMKLPEYTEIAQNDVLYYYRYIPATNTYEVAASASPQTFEVMQAYMVQYAGDIKWTGASQDTPQQIAARRNADAGPEKVSLNLELAQDDLTADKTFIQLQEEGATADFDMNKDLTKIINAGANIYTLVGEGNIQTAGNVLPMGECEVPVGVKVDAAGKYTFRMPDGTEGMVVELIDYYTNTRTNLLLFGYTITLPAGTSEDRFALHIQPSKSGVATDIDQLTGSELNANGVQKFIIDGRLYLKKDGVLYDAQGHSRSAVGVR